MAAQSGGRRARAPFPWRKQVTLLLVLAATIGAPAGRGQHGPNEYQLKAAFLFNFAKFIDWPANSFESPRAPFSICVLGKDPFGRALDDALLNKQINDRPVMILRTKNPETARHCQILFVGTAEGQNLPAILNELRGANCLLVGESEGFAAAGGTIQFTIEDNHVRFLINPEAGERAGLRFSSKLLALAKIVHDASPGGRG
jgi:hypothetical protein